MDQALLNSCCHSVKAVLVANATNINLYPFFALIFCLVGVFFVHLFGWLVGFVLRTAI